MSLDNVKFCEIKGFSKCWFLNYNVSAFPTGLMNEQNEYVVYEFGSFRVDTLKRQLFRDGAPVQLTSKAFDTLAMLLAHDGATVLKAELMNAIWPETAVEENNLTQQISALRKALGERAGEQSFIVTVKCSGYCFAAQVGRLQSD